MSWSAKRKEAAEITCVMILAALIEILLFRLIIPVISTALKCSIVENMNVGSLAISDFVKNALLFTVNLNPALVAEPSSDLLLSVDQ